MRELDLPLPRGRLITVAASLALLLVAGCGGSSSSSSSSSPGPPSGAPGGTRRAALRACLKQQGVNVPQRPAGGGGPFGGGAQGQMLANPRFRAALQKCGGRPGAGRFRRNNPAYRQGLTTFAACMRTNGIDLPAPNTSGRGPIFRLGKLNSADPKFKTALGKCRPLLQFRRGGGGGPGSGPRPGA